MKIILFFACFFVLGQGLTQNKDAEDIYITGPNCLKDYGDTVQYTLHGLPQKHPSILWMPAMGLHILNWSSDTTTVTCMVSGMVGNAAMIVQLGDWKTGKKIFYPIYEKTRRPTIIINHPVHDSFFYLPDTVLHTDVKIANIVAIKKSKFTISSSTDLWTIGDIKAVSATFVTDYSIKFNLNLDKKDGCLYIKTTGACDTRTDEIYITRTQPQTKN